MRRFASAMVIPGWPGAYTELEWFFPQHGERFDPKGAYNICTWR